MILNAGYQFSKASKKWMAAFLLNAAIVGVPAEANAQPGNAPHYMLIDLDGVKQREQQAQTQGDIGTVAIYEQARIALQDTVDGKRATPNDLPGDFDRNLYTEDNQGNEYHVIETSGDIDWTTFTLAQKTAQVLAEKVAPGTIVETILANGLHESTKTAGPDGGYRVTNPTGEQYLVDTAKFEKIYEAADAPSTYKPKPDPRKVVSVNENVAFTAPWGQPMYIRMGGVLVHEKPRSVYGIQPDEYAQTYSPIQTPG